MKQQDFSKQLIINCKAVKKILVSLENLWAKVDNNIDVGYMDRLLVLLHVYVHQIYKVANPLPSTGAIHGLPEEATDEQFNPKPIAVHTGRPSWDFRPWFLEKTTRLQEATDYLIELIETYRQETIHGSHKDKHTVVPSLKQQLRLFYSTKRVIKTLVANNLAEAKHVDDALLELLCSGELKIIEIKPPEEDDGNDV